MALLELSDGLSNEACVSFGEINWFVLRRCLLWRPLLFKLWFVLVQWRNWKGWVEWGGRAKQNTQASSGRGQRKKKKGGVGMRWVMQFAVLEHLHFILAESFIQAKWALCIWFIHSGSRGGDKDPVDAWIHNSPMWASCTKLLLFLFFFFWEKKVYKSFYWFVSEPNIKFMPRRQILCHADVISFLFFLFINCFHQTWQFHMPTEVFFPPLIFCICYVRRCSLAHSVKTRGTRTPICVSACEWVTKIVRLGFLWHSIFVCVCVF